MKIKHLATLTSIAAALLFGATGARADTASSDFAMTGNFTATCSFTNPTFSLGSVDLSAYIFAASSVFEHARIPATVTVTCNSTTVGWNIFNTGDTEGVPMTIGANTDNFACVANDNSNNALPVCAKSTSTGVNLISGVGSMVRNVIIATYNNTGTRTAFKGSGANSATVPLTLAF